MSEAQRPTSAQTRPQSASRSRPQSASKAQKSESSELHLMSEDAEVGIIKDDFEASSSEEEFLTPVKSAPHSARTSNSVAAPAAATNEVTPEVPPASKPLSQDPSPPQRASPKAPRAPLSSRSSQQEERTIDIGSNAEDRNPNLLSTSHEDLEATITPKVAAKRAQGSSAKPHRQSQSHQGVVKFSPPTSKASTPRHGSASSSVDDSAPVTAPPPSSSSVTSAGPTPRARVAASTSSPATPAPVTAPPPAPAPPQAAAPPPPHQGEAEPSPAATDVLYVHRWRPAHKGLPTPPKAERWAGDVAGDNLLLYGGVIGGKPSCSLFGYNRRTAAWKPLGSGSGEKKPPAAVGHSFTRLTDKLFVLAGGGTDTTYVFDRASSTWYRVPASVSLAAVEWRQDARDPNDRKHHTAVSYGNSIVVFGGTTKLGKTNLVDRFSVTTGVEKGVWTADSTPSSDGRPSGGAASNATDVPPLSHHTTVVVDDRMIVFGGKDATGDQTNAVHMYEFASRRFSAFVVNDDPNGPSPRSGHSAVLSPNKLEMFVYGGSTGQCSFSAELWALDVNDYIWRRIDVRGAPPRALGVMALFDPAQSRRRAVDSDDEQSPRDAGPVLCYVGGGALPESGSRYAQLAFKASEDLLLFATQPPAHVEDDEAADGDAAAAADHPEDAPRAGRRTRPSTAPMNRHAQADSTPRAVDDEAGGAAEHSGDETEKGKRASSAASKQRRHQRWNLTGDFPPPPPVQRGPLPTAISAKTLHRLCPSKEDRDKKREKLLTAVQPLYVSKVRLTKQQLAEAAKRMCDKELDLRTQHAAAARDKLLASYAGKEPPKKVTETDVEALTHKLYKTDSERFARVHKHLADKFGFVYTPRVVLSATREQLNARFYESRKDEADRIIQKVRRKHIKDTPAKVLNAEELAEAVERLAKQPEPRSPH